MENSFHSVFMNFWDNQVINSEKNRAKTFFLWKVFS